MIKLELKCPGCGAVIQSDDPSKSGYINKNVLEKRKDDFLCERCFKLKHYNQVKIVETKNIDFDNVFSEISTEKSLIVNIIDSFDLLGSVITNLNELFPNSLVLIIANKFDLFLRSNRPTKLRTYLKAYLKEKNIEFCDLLVTSSLDSASAKPIYETIKKYSRNRNVYFVGMANVGKSTLLNTISKEYGDKIDLTTSQAMFNMVINKNYVVEYIYYYLYYLYISNFYNSIVSTGTQSNLNAEQIKLLDIYIPCYNEQKRIYEQFSKIDFKINLEQKKINELLYLKKGLMQNMFV